MKNTAPREGNLGEGSLKSGTNSAWTVGGEWKENPFENLPVGRIRYLLISRDTGERARVMKRAVRINNVDLVRRVAELLSRRRFEDANVFPLLGSRSVVFLDKEENVLIAFRYWPFGKPKHVFEVAQARRIKNGYEIGDPAMRNGQYIQGYLTLPDFDKIVKQYIDVWEAR